MTVLLLAFTLQIVAEPIRIPVAPAESLAVTIVGNGAPVVMIPGLFGSTYGYRHVMTLLTDAGYQSVGIEPLGMGSSARPPDSDYSLTSQADRIAAVLDTLDIRRAVLVGHAVGASIAMRVAYRRPELVRGIVSLEGGPGEAAMTRGFRRYMRFAPVAGMIDGRGIIQHIMYREMKSKSFDASWVDKDMVLAYTRGLADDFKATIKAYKRMGKSEEPERLHDHLSAIACPVVLLVGSAEHDAGPSAKELTLLAEQLPSFTVDTVDRSGFFIYEEGPEAVVGVVTGIGHGEDCAPDSNS
jgi:pimeloyl-ACP methyl ester carboxylesterase